MKKPKPPKKKKNILRAWLYAFLAISLVVFVGSVRNAQTVTSRASETGGARSLLPPPSIRLVVPTHVVQVGEAVPVDVYVDSGSVGTLETRVVVTYDPAVFTISSSDVVPTSLYHAVNTEQAADGRLEASFFVTPEAGYEPVVTSGEQKAATLTFTARQAADRSAISLAYDGTDPELSGIFVAGSEGTGNARNILRNVLGVTVSVIR